MSQPQKSGAGYALAVLFCINMMNFYDRTIPGAVGELIKKDWNLSDSTLGLIGTAFILLYAIVGIPLGRLSDRYNRKMLLGVSVFFWSLLTAASGLARNVWQLAALRLAVGVGEATCAPAASSLIGDLYPARQRARAMSVFMLGLPIGVAACFFVSGFVAQKAGWPSAFFVALVPGLLCTVGVLFMREPERGASEAHQIGGRKRPGSAFGVVLSIPTMRWIIISGALLNLVMYALGTFLVSFLIRVHGVDISRATVLVSVIYGLAGLPGLFVGGALGDRVGSGRGRLLVGAIASGLSAPFLYFGFDAAPGELWTAVPLLFCGSMTLYMYYSTVYSTIQDVIEPALRGTAMALYFFAMYLLGGALGPYGFGILSDVFKKRLVDSGVSEQVAIAQGLHTAMYAAPLFALLLFIVLMAGARTVNADVEGLRRWMSESTDA